MGLEPLDQSDRRIVPFSSFNITTNHPAARIALCACVMLLLSAAVGPARSEAVQQFWNTSTQTFTGVFLAPAGSNRWGANQTANDPDGAVDPRERAVPVVLERPDFTRPGVTGVRPTVDRGLPSRRAPIDGADRSEPPVALTHVVRARIRRTTYL